MVEKLKILSYTDSLTGIANRRYFDRRILIEFKRNLFKKKEISILMIDVDHFKKFNDHYGHMSGDKCLRKIASIIDEIVSAPACLAARFGGEEFACILPGYNNQQAIQMAEKIRSTIENLRIVHNSMNCSQYITVSIGVATALHFGCASAQSCLRAADAALYKAKNKGRNCVESCYYNANIKLHYSMFRKASGYE
ncbi:MAG: GGDEF domain-containing protein [Negativicutes bacterium]